MGRTHTTLCLTLAGLVGCMGAIGDATGTPDAPPDPTDPVVDLRSCGDAAPSPSTRMPRLSHAQLANTLGDLLRLDAPPSEPASFVSDPQDSGFDNDGTRLAISPTLGRAYQRLAESLAAAAAASPGEIFAPCETTDTACVSSRIRDFGRRAYRRPLSSGEMDAYLTLFARGPELVGAGDAFEDGVRLVVEAMLQSPNFLYRLERSQLAADGVIALDSWEVASRLSYALWGSMPDDALFAEAERDALLDPREVGVQAERMLDDPRAARMIDDFYRQLLHLDAYVEIDRDPALNPAWTDGVVADLRTEVQMFTQEVVLRERGGVHDLLTASFTFANDRTVAIYGEDVIDDPGGSGFRRIELEPSRRAGFLTQLGFLASNAYRSETDPIHRGVFLHRQVLCSALPDPPDDVNTTLPPASGELRTTRQRVEHATSGPSCQGCHLLINEPGFAFESFDAIGQFRTHDNDVAVDTTGALPVDGELVPFDDAVGLAHAVADSRAASECYTRQYFRYAHGRSEAAGDCRALSDFSSRLRDGGLDLRSLMVEVVTHPSFLTRTDEVSE